jgi:hypothetical protein
MYFSTAMISSTEGFSDPFFDRMEFGTSLNPGKPLRENPAIVRDRNGSLRLEMPRDHPSLVQHSQ